MNEIVSKFLLAGDKYMRDMHLTQLAALDKSGFTYKVCGPFTENKERIQKFIKTGYSRSICLNELDKACFQHDMAYGNFKDLTRRIASDKILRDKAFNIAKNLNMMDINVDLLHWFINFLIKKFLLEVVLK